MLLLKKYQHYLIVTCALLVALYVTDPLWQTHLELKETASLAEKRASKMNNLLSHIDALELELAKAAKANELVAESFYRSDNEGELKLAVQQKINVLFEKANCSIDTVSWQGDTQVTSNIDKWRFKISFNGPPVCLVKLTRSIEAEKPVIRFENYSLGNRDSWQGQPSSRLNGSIELAVWHLKGTL